jgi:acyl-CoA dehydrogenase-like protein
MRSTLRPTGGSARGHLVCGGDDGTASSTVSVKDVFVPGSRTLPNVLFEASGASQTMLDADIQRYFRDINVVHQHATIQPNSSHELYGRLLAGLEPEYDF